VKFMTKLTPEPDTKHLIPSDTPELRRRVIIIVLDGAGIGALPDASLYGDHGAATLPHVSREAGGLQTPQLASLGLGNLSTVQGVPPSPSPRSSYGSMALSSPGKDTTTGHWELAGLILEKPFPVYPQGFPPEIIEPFKKSIGKDILGNKAASGTEIIEELGEQHLSSGAPIVYTSADSVFQVAAHREVVSLETLYEWCIRARHLLKEEHGVSRVIARPFTGAPGNFIRTTERKDFALPPPRPTILDWVSRAGKEVVTVGKVKDIFAGQGVTSQVSARGGNREIAAGILEAMLKTKEGLIWATLVDFDMLYGHRNDVKGFARALEEFDHFLLLLHEHLQPDDLVVITADHGCDPTWPGTDHTREYVPLLVFGDRINKGISLGTRKTLADLGATVLDYLDVKGKIDGESFWHIIKSP